MKILLYGGCHAQVMRDYFEAAYDVKEIQVDLIINFDLIGSGAPFPLSRLAACDAFVYSPIENKGTYNTAELAGYSRDHRKIAICFPWLEWHGYCPGATKGFFKSRHQWYFPDLTTIAAGFATFEAFRDHVVDRYPSDDTIDHFFHLSSERVTSAEKRQATTVCLSDLIADHYARSRLFLVSDHPSRVTYAHIVRQIVEQLGLPFVDDALPAEPQPECRTPIFPRVTRRLGLSFDDREWVDDVWTLKRSSDLESYLRLYHHADGDLLLSGADAASLERGDDVALGSRDSRVPILSTTST